MLAFVWLFQLWYQSNKTHISKYNVLWKCMKENDKFCNTMYCILYIINSFSRDRPGKVYKKLNCIMWRLGVMSLWTSNNQTCVIRSNFLHHRQTYTHTNTYTHAHMRMHTQWGKDVCFRTWFSQMECMMSVCKTIDWKIRDQALKISEKSTRGKVGFSWWTLPCVCLCVCVCVRVSVCLCVFSFFQFCWCCGNFKEVKPRRGKKDLFCFPSACY